MHQPDNIQGRDYHGDKSFHSQPTEEIRRFNEFYLKDDRNLAVTLITTDKRSPLDLSGKLKYIFRITYSEKRVGFDWLPNLSSARKRILRNIADQIYRERKGDLPDSK